MPAYNAAKTIEKTYRDIPADTVDDIIVVDDVSQDETVAIASQLGLHVIVHLQNKGYGGNQKSCYIEALKRGADIVVMLHPDYQYDSTRIPALIDPIRTGAADMVLGTRFLTRGGPRAGGMPLWRYIPNRFLTALENLAFRQQLSECHTGFRAYSRRFLLTAPFLLNSDNFVFDSEIIAQAAHFGFTISEVEIPTRYFPEASSVSFRKAVVYGLQTVGVVARYMLHRFRLRKDLILSCELSQIVSPLHRRALIEGDAGSDEGTAKRIRLQ
jgi:glycosyltransferase involved in cell wall biosynthesis